MKTKYKCTQFKKRKSIWNCINKKVGEVGYIFDYGTIWCFIPLSNVVFGVNSLLEIADFLQQLNEAKK